MISCFAGTYEIALSVLRVVSGSDLYNRVGKVVLAGHTAKRSAGLN